MKLLSTFFVVCLLCFATINTAKAQLPVDVYGALPEVSMMAISPSGDSVAYRSAADGKDRVLIYNLKEKKFRGGVDVEDIKPRFVYFVNEDTLILRVEKNAKLAGFRGRHDINSAFAFNIKENKIKQMLIPGDGIYKGQSGLGRVIGISEDGKNAYMVAWENAAQFTPFRVSLTKRRTPISIKRGKSDAIDYFMDGDTLVARELFDNDEDLHRVQKLVDGTWVDIYREQTSIRTRSFVGFSADKQSLVMLTQGEHGRRAYYTLALEDGSITGPLFNPSDKDVERVITDIDRVVHGVQYSGFNPSYDFFDERVDKLVKQTVNDLPGYSVWIEDYTDDWSSIVFYIEGPDSPGDYYINHNGGFEFIASSREKISKHGVYQVAETEIKTRDGLRIPALLTLPAVEKLENLPAILMPHGGPESYDRMGFDYMAQYFASRGYLVMQPQFRGSTGFGLDFKLKGRGEWGRKMQDDLTDTVKTLVKSGYVDKDRVCIVGGSYGGYAALAGAAFTPDMFKCAVSINGVADIEKMLRDEERDFGDDHWVVEYWNRVIAQGEVDENHIRDISPINHIDKIKAPVLLVHGTRDKVVPFEHSEDMFDEMEDANKLVKLVELEKGDHYLSVAENRMKALKAIDEFVSQHLQ